MLLVAGTLVTVTAGGGVTAVELDGHPSPSPSLEAPADEPDVDEAEAEDEDGDEDEPAGQPVALRPETTCATDDVARTAARERVSSAFVVARNALDELRSAHRGARAGETLERAETLLREIADKADRALAEMCEDVAVVADRAVAAMETVVNLARSAAEATPTPTERPKPKATPKPSRTPRCDDRLYESKLKMHAAYEKYHRLHDKLYYAHKRSSSPVAKTVIANDQLIHRTYDESKRAILSAGCAGDLGAAAAARAAATFERAYQSSAQAVAAQGR